MKKIFFISIFGQRQTFRHILRKKKTYEKDIVFISIFGQRKKFIHIISTDI